MWPHVKFLSTSIWYQYACVQHMLSNILNHISIYMTPVSRILWCACKTFFRVFHEGVECPKPPFDSQRASFATLSTKKGVTWEEGSFPITMGNHSRYNRYGSYPGIWKDITYSKMVYVFGAWRFPSFPPHVKVSDNCPKYLGEKLRFSYGNRRYFAPQMCVFHMLVWNKNHADRRKKKSESRYRWSHIRIFSCLIGILSSESYSFFHNHGSVENGYVWKVTIITEIRPCFTSIYRRKGILIWGWSTVAYVFIAYSHVVWTKRNQVRDSEDSEEALRLGINVSGDFIEWSWRI